MALIFHNQSFNKSNSSVSADNIINDFISTDEISDFILIVPTGKLTRHLKYQAIEDYYNATGKPCSDINIMNLNKFAELLFNTIFSNNNYRLLSESYRLALTEESAVLSDLEFYKENSNRFYYHVIERLSNIIYGLREDGITHQNMADDLSRNDPENIEMRDSKKFSDIAKIFAGYEKILEGKYLDPPALINLLIKYADEYVLANPEIQNSSFDDILRSINPNLKRIAIYGFSEFKIPEVALLSKFAASKIPLTIHLDFSEINGPLFGNLRRTNQVLIDAGFVFYYTDDELQNQNIPNIFDHDLNKHPKYFLRRWLFNVEREVKYPFAGMKNMLNIFEFANIDDEVVQISKLIKNLICDGGYSPADIAVVSRDIGLYSDLFREQLYLERIPANFSDRYPLSSSQVVISILSVLDTISDEFRLADVIRANQSSFVKVKRDGIDIDISNIIKVTSELRFPTGKIPLKKAFWTKKITNAIEYLKKIIGDSSVGSTSDIDIRSLNSRLENYEKALLDFESFADKMPVIKQELTPDEFKNLIVEDIIKRFGIADKIRNLYNNIFSESESRTQIEIDIEIGIVEKYSRAITEFMRVTDEMVFIMNDRNTGKMKLKKYIEKLKLLVSAAKYQIRDKNKYGVTVTAIEQIREVPYKVTILCGLNDSIFPASYKPESFLGINLRDSEERHLHSEQIQFYQFLVNGLDLEYIAQKKIYLTYSKYIQSYEIAPSSFIDSLLKVTDIKTVKFAELSEESISESYPWFDSISNRPEIASYIGEYIFNTKINNGTLSDIPGLDRSDPRVEIITKFADILVDRKTNIGNQIYSHKSQAYLQKIQTKAFSATDFDTYAKCSYQYFAKRVLKLKELDQTESTINPMEFGNIMHLALYKFYTRLQEAYSSDFISNYPTSESLLPKLKPVVIDNIPELKQILRDIIALEFADVRLDNAITKISQREILGSDDLIGWADMFIDSELGRQYIAYPALFEFEFGMAGSGGVIQPIELAENLMLRGKIDRVEFTPDLAYPSGTDPRLFFTIVDYKSSESGTSSNSKIEKSQSFQMPLYALAMQKILKDYYGIDVHLRGGAYYILKPKTINGKIKDVVTVLMPTEIDYIERKQAPDTQDELLNHSLKSALGIVSSITKGEFSANPINTNACKYCNFDTLCRIQERTLTTNFEIPESPESEQNI